MKHGVLAILGALALSGLSSQARAADDLTRDDLRCAIVALSIAGSGKEAQTVGMMSMFYYLGRLDGRTPDLDLENRLIDEIAVMKPADLKAAAQRCGAFLVVRGQKLQEVGKRLQERAGKTPPNPAVLN
jgi:hypothetical protein